MTARRVSRYRRETDRVLDHHAKLAAGISAMRCECGAWWTVDREGRPLSWLGEWALEYHAGHDQRVAA